MFYASVDLQGSIVRLLARKQLVFRRNSVCFTQNLSKKLKKCNASGPRGWGCYIDGIRTWSCDHRPRFDSCISYSYL